MASWPNRPKHLLGSGGADAFTLTTGNLSLGFA